MVIGLTGGMACGKSTAAGFFAEAGFLTADNDRIAHDLLAGDTAVIAAIRQHFGDGVLEVSGAVSRKALAERVFTNSDELVWLENLLHPLVAKSWQRAVRASPDRDWVVQIPLLFEKRLEESVDLTVCVVADGQTQRQRLHQRGLADPDISRRFARQWPLQVKMERSGHVLLNTGSLSFLRKQVVFLIQSLSASRPIEY